MGKCWLSGGLDGSAQDVRKICSQVGLKLSQQDMKAAIDR
jgi:hypothetical protein